MKIRREIALAAALLLALSLTPPAGAAVSVEIAAEAGPQATAQREWLQLFADAGVTAIRIRSVRPGDKPRIEDLGTPDRPRPKLHAVLTRDGVLRAPRARFTLRDRAKLGAYLERLGADGAEGITADRGRFGLTKPQFEEVFAALATPIGPIDDGATLAGVVDSARDRSPLPIATDPGVAAALRTPAEGAPKLRRLTTGTALALLLRQEGLALVAEKPTGEPLTLRVVTAHGRDETWPAGYKPERSPRETAPALFEWLTVEIDGFSLQQAVDAIEPRLSTPDRPLPIVWDHFALRRDQIAPATTPVKLAPKRTFYKRILDQLAFQARLKAELRVDEAGAPFVWLTR